MHALALTLTRIYVSKRALVWTCIYEAEKSRKGKNTA